VTIKIEHGIKVPAKNLYVSYPFTDMKIGDSIFIGFGDIQGLRCAATVHKRRHPEFNYMTRKTEKGYRLWRVPVAK